MGRARQGRYLRKTKHRTPDMDQIQESIQKEVLTGESKKREFDPDLPGGGQCYCIICDRHFITDSVLAEHYQTRTHKKRVKAAQVPAVTQREVDAASGLSAPDFGMVVTSTKPTAVLAAPAPEVKMLSADT
eukprot:EC788191.1.p1 GENE.EC788191.1~~EC788191.1.p1  ORF type:complete len:131 (+),score=30.08 EC788191.1:33-425(+)